MSTSITISTIAMSQAASAQASAKRAECRVIMKDYTDKGSTVEQKQTYAECVQLIHPVNNIIESVVGGVLITAVVGLAVGVLYAMYKDLY